MARPHSHDSEVRQRASGAGPGDACIELAKVECKSFEHLTKEQPAAYDSQSNGGTEVGVRLVRGLLRTVKLCLEARIGKYIPVDHAVMPWMVEHVCLLLNVVVRGEDGITSWQRVRGRLFGQQMLGFGESILYRYPNKGPLHAPDGNVGALGAEGLFLGYSTGSNTFRVIGEHGLVAARSMTRRSQEARWSADALAKIRVIPGSHYVPQGRGQVRFDQGATATGPTADVVKASSIRKLRINQSDLEEHGYYTACAQCTHIQRHGRPRAGTTHSTECRNRIIEAMKLTEGGRARLELQEERVEQAKGENAAGVQPPVAAPPQPEPKGFLDRIPEPTLPPGRAEDDPSAIAYRDRAREYNGRGTPQPGRSGTGGESGVPFSIPDAESAGHVPTQEGRTARVQTKSQGPSGLIGADRDTAAAARQNADAAAEMETDDRQEADEDAMNTDFVGNFDVADSLGRLEPSFDDEVSTLLLNQLGSVGRSHRRESCSAARRLVTEVYSPPRITKLIRESRMRHVMPGYALDLTTVDPTDGMPWDFSIRKKRIRARKMIREQRPYLVIGSPQCKEFCTWQRLNAARYPDDGQRAAAREAAVVHLEFVSQLYQDQIDGGRYFLHEHPRWATSWSLRCIEKISNQSGVVTVHGDQCQYGAETQSSDGVSSKGAPILKPTGFMTNSPA